MLSDADILNAYEKGDIIISPFNEKQLKLASYDVCLGEYFYRECASNSGLFNIWSKTGVDAVWRQGEWMTREQLMKEYPEDCSLLEIEKDAKIILLMPGECILAHTEEFIGGVRGINTKMSCRSSYGRCNISVCLCSGFGDPGYYNRWTMEIKNMSHFNPIPLIIGRPIAQISFYKLITPESSTYSKDGHYQESTKLGDIMNKWSPQDMLPRLYKK